MTIAQVLAGAARLVETGRYEHGVHLPMARAIHDATHNPVKYYVAAYDAMAAFLGVHYLHEWNQQCLRTGPEVATWLSSAAEWAKVRGE